MNFLIHVVQTVLQSLELRIDSEDLVSSTMRCFLRSPSLSYGQLGRDNWPSSTSYKCLENRKLVNMVITLEMSSRRLDVYLYPVCPGSDTKRLREFQEKGLQLILLD